MALKPLNFRKLAKILAMADSDREGEAVNALRKARQILSGSGLSFLDLADRVGSGAGDIQLHDGTHAEAEEREEALEREINRLKAESKALKAKIVEMDKHHKGVEQELRLVKERQSASSRSTQQFSKAMWGVLAEKDSEIARLRAKVQEGLRQADETPTPPPEEAARMLENEAAQEASDEQDNTPQLRSATERREAVKERLRDPETSKLSDREIARQVGVSPQTVSNWRKRLFEEEGLMQDPERVVVKGGKEYRMNTSRIGQGIAGE